MKKILYLVGLVALASGIGMAACMGPFCYDDTGAYVNGQPMNGNGIGIPVLSSTSISNLGGVYVGQTVICNTCANTSGSYALCIATATTGVKFIITGSTNAVTQCK